MGNLTYEEVAEARKSMKEKQWGNTEQKVMNQLCTGCTRTEQLVAREGIFIVDRFSGIVFQLPPARDVLDAGDREPDIIEATFFGRERYVVDGVRYAADYTKTIRCS